MSRKLTALPRRAYKKQWATSFRLQYFSQGRGYSKYPRPIAMFPAPMARNIIACWDNVPEFIRAVALEMLEEGKFPQPATIRATPFSNVVVGKPEPAPEPPRQSFPEDPSEEYVDADTEMELQLWRVFSGPDLERALGRKLRLGLAGDKPYDCPVDPATGRLKQPPDPPGER